MPKKVKTKARVKPKAAGKGVRGGLRARKPLAAAIATPAKAGKSPSGIPGLDGLIEGGFEQKSVIVVAGGPGDGKSTFGLQFLYEGATKYGENGMYIVFEEEKEAVYRHMLRYGFDFARLEKERKFAFIAYPPEEIERFVDEGGIIEDMINELGVKRIVIDTVTSFLMVHEDEYRRRQVFIKLMKALRKWGCTTILVSEGDVGPGGELHTHYDIEFVSDGLIDLQMVRKGRSAGAMIEIIKMRGTAIAHTQVPLRFTKRGLAVAAGKG